MKILLIRPNLRGAPLETNITGVYPPLGIAYLASVLRKAGHEAAILDNEIMIFGDGRVRNHVTSTRPDMVLISCTTPLWKRAVDIGRIVKEVSDDIIVGIGGPHLSVYPRETLAEPCFDFGMYGEGEETVLEAVSAAESGKSFESIKGCVVRNGKGVTITPPREEIEDLDSLPLPSIDLLPYRDYFALSVKRPFFSMVTTRGCPYRCAFCFQGYLGRYRSRSAENVVDEMETLVRKYGIREIVMFDETFAVEKERAIRICDLVRERGISVRWSIRTRVDLMDRKLLSSLKAAGCYELHMGIESGNQGVLDRMRKDTRLEDIRKAVGMAKQAGFIVRGYFMLAYPGETRRTITETIEFSKSLPLDWASFTVTIGLPGTEMYKKAMRDNVFGSDYWVDAASGAKAARKPYFVPDGMRVEDLFSLKRRAYLEFYKRPRIIKQVLMNIGIGDIITCFPRFLRLMPGIYGSMARV
ncbi:MAG: radical SAM protein [Candidatus Omnitrophota bacterium]